jgi:hypothetical protein
MLRRFLGETDSMRVSTLVIMAAAATVALPAAAQIAAPQRKPGFWEQTMTMTGGRAMKSQICTDAAVEKSMSAFGQNMAQSTCSKNQIRKTPTGFAFDSTCKVGSSVVNSTGTATGDFNSAYVVDVSSKSTPPMVPGKGETHMKIAAKWLGPCPAGRKAGDMVMPGGMVVNIANMSRPAR